MEGGERFLFGIFVVFLLIWIHTANRELDIIKQDVERIVTRLKRVEYHYYAKMHEGIQGIPGTIPLDDDKDKIK